jgi:hypothetical protein
MPNGDLDLPINEIIKTDRSKAEYEKELAKHAIIHEDGLPDPTCAICKRLLGDIDNCKNVTKRF